MIIQHGTESNIKINIKIRFYTAMTEAVFGTENTLKSGFRISEF
jgi:hypothetical protein